MNNNTRLEDTMDRINNIAFGYGFKNGIEWANAAYHNNEISWLEFKNYENTHNLRVRYSHGNARDIFVSYETCKIAEEWERNIRYSRLRKKRDFSRNVRLPDGAYRCKTFTKEFNRSGVEGRNYYFRFQIVYEYQERNYDDGTSFKGYGYTIYVKESPYKDWCLVNNTEYEFHFYASPYYNPSICWNKLITDFQDANAVMLVWVKRYCKILDHIFLNGKVNMHKINRNNNNRILPTGTFRSKEDTKGMKNIYIDRKVYDDIMSILGKRKPELGGMLGWKDDQDYIDYFVFDEKAVVGRDEYNPDTAFLSSIINGEWLDKRIFLAGFVHSHPMNVNMLSDADVEYAQRIMEVFDIDYLFMPIVTSDYEYKSTFNPYIITREGNVQKCKLKITNKTKGSIGTLTDSTNKLNSIEAEFEKMGKINPIYSINDRVDNDTTFSRISNVIDIDYMKSCTIIGIGCGGSRSFYESMARVGVGNFYLMDGDKSSYSNIASQNGYISEVGMYKPEVVKKRLMDIDKDINVTTFNCMLDDSLDDEFIEKEIISKIDVNKTVLCAFTDNFYAQARISRIALKYRIPFLCGQHHEGGSASELIFWYPGITKYSLREIAKSRYESYERGYVNTVTSNGSPIFNTTRLNALCEKIATGLLLYSNYPTHIYSKFIDYKRDMNLILIKQKWLDPTQDLYDLFDNGLSNFFDETIWIHPESIEDLNNVVLEELNISDTRNIFDKE